MGPQAWFPSDDSDQSTRLLIRTETFALCPTYSFGCQTRTAKTLIRLCGYAGDAILAMPWEKDAFLQEFIDVKIR